LRDLPHQKIPRELCGGEDPAIFSMFPCSYGKIFRWDKSGKFKKTRKKEWRKEKEGFFLFFLFLTYMEGPILVCSPSVGNALGYRLRAILP